MKKQGNFKYWPIQAILFIVFVCVYLASNFPVFDLQKATGTDSMLFTGFFITDLSNHAQDPEENMESETDIFSESIFGSHQIEHPLLCYIKKRPGYGSSLFLPDHLELFSPPPEFC